MFDTFKSSVGLWNCRIPFLIANILFKKSTLCAKITLSTKKIVSRLSFNTKYTPFICAVTVYSKNYTNSVYTLSVLH